MKSLKQKIISRELTIGSWITLGHPAIAEIMARAGYDWLTIDMEHSVITFENAQSLIQVIELSGCVPLVRVGVNDATIIKRVMDAGAHGVIVPMVNSREDAERAVKAVKYPPRGNRGVGLARAQGYGSSFEQYKRWLEDESIVIVQIEHIDAVHNLEDILGVDGIDGFIVGPYDLSGSLGVPGQFNHPDMITALERVKDVSEKLNIYSGYHVVESGTGLMEQKIMEGYKFIAHSLDILFLGDGCRNSLNTVRGMKK